MDNAISQMWLKKALADELLAAYQYWTARHSSRGEGKTDADDEYEQHAKEEMEHAEKIMLRLKELGGSPIMDPANLTKYSNPWTPIASREVKEQLDTTIQAEKDAIVFYRNGLEAMSKNDDPTTQQLFKQILADEEEHLYDLSELLVEVSDDPHTSRERLTAATL